MPLRKTPLQLLPQGIETSTAPHHLAPGQLVLAENVRFTRKGEVRKRFAFGSSLSSGTGGTGVTSRRAVGIATDGTSLFVHSENVGDAAARNAYTVYKLAASGDFWGKYAVGANAICEATLTKSGALQSAPLAIASAVELPSGMRAEFNVQTGSTTTAATSVLVSSTQVVHLWLVPSGASSTIWARLDTYTPTAYSAPETDGFISGANTSVVTNAVGTGTATPYFDAVYLSTSDEIAIAFRSSATDYKIVSINPTTLAVTAKTVTVTTNSDKVLAFLEQDESGGRFYLGVAGSAAGVRVMEHNIASFALSGTQTMDAAILDARQITGFRRESTTTTGIMVEAVGRITATYRDVACLYYIGTGTGSGTYGTSVQNAGLYSRAFTWTNFNSADVFCQYAIVTDGAIQTTVYVLNWGQINNGAPGAYTTTAIGRALADSASGPLPIPSCLPRVSTVSADVRTWNCLARRSFDVSGSTFLSDMTAHRFVVDLSSQSLSGPAELGGLHYPGGIVANAAGEDSIGFYPEIVSAVGAAGGALTVTSAYSYTAVFRRTSAGGDVHRSAEAFSVNVTLTGAQQSVTLTFKAQPALLRYQFGAQLWLDVYRTPAGGDGTAFYKCASIFPASSTPTSTLNDTMSDAALITKEKLYTTGDVLENVAPPSSRIVIAWKNRLVAAQRRGAWISKEYGAGFGVGFNDTITIGFDDPGGDITACAVSDDRLYFHRAGGVWALSGDGPTDTGDGGYERPQLVATVPGALKPKLVAVTPLGQFYVNSLGVQLLDRGHNSTFVGAPIEQLFTPSTAKKVIYLGEAQEVRVLTTSGSDFVYDMVAQTWSVDTHAGTPFVDAVVWNGAMVGLTATGGVYQEGVAYQDQAATSYAMKIKTGRISGAGIAGLQALFEITATGECMAACTLRITVTTYGAGTTRSEVFNRTLTVGRMNARAQLRHSQCSEFEVQVEEIASSGQAFRLEALTAWIGTLPGPDPVRSAGRMTPT